METNVIPKLGYHVGQNLHAQILKWKKDNESNDQDKVIVIDGAEGVGKSTFACRLAYAYDQNITIDNNWAFKPEKGTHSFKNQLKKISKDPKIPRVLIFDEGFTGLSSRTSLSKVNKLLVEKMMEMRQLNMLTIVVLPSFFMLDKYVALHRSTALFHVYKNKKGRRCWRGYNKKKKKMLYIKGKQLMSYAEPKIGINKGQFYKMFPVDYKKYIAAKRAAFDQSDEEVDTKSEDSRYLVQRNLLLAYLMNNHKYTQRSLSQALEPIGFVDKMALKQQTLSGIWSEYKERVQNTDNGAA